MNRAERTEYKRKWDARNPELVREYRKRGRAKLLARRQYWLNVIRHEIGCENCGSREKVQFHHRNPDEKRYKISTLLGAGQPTFLSELEKCDLLCEDCHWHTHRSRGSLNETKTGRFHVSYHTPDKAKAEQILALIRDATA